MATDTIKQALGRRGLLQHVALTPALDGLLDSLACTVPAKVPDGDDVTGKVTFASNQKLGFLALNLTPPATPLDYRLITEAGGTVFRFWLVLSSLSPASKVFDFATGAAGVVLKAASYQASGDQEKLVPAAGDVSIQGIAVALLIEGRVGQTATLNLTPTVGQPAGVIELQLVPKTVLIGDSGFGLEFADDGAFFIDDSTEAVPTGKTLINGAEVVTRADTPAWRGLGVRHARFYVPPGVPFLGGHAVDAYVEVGTAAGDGIDLAISTHIPPKDSRPGIDVMIECRDPAATGLQDFIPTLVELSMKLPLDGMSQPSAGGGITLLAGKPVIARARFARSVSDPETRLTLSVESQGDDGVLAVVAPGGGTAARVLITAAALATAIVADKAPDGADSGAVVLNALLTVALGLSSCLKDQGRFVIHKVELSSTGHGLPVGEQVKLLIDYSVNVLVRPIDVGVLSVQMRDEQPMRVRNRNVALTINLSGASGLDTIQLDFSRADMEIEDPGAWMVNSPASLFDILGTRSGRGSTWLEVDLRFKLNLGPVRVSGATIRATLEDSGTITATLRGLDASIALAGVIEGEGALEMRDGGGFYAKLDVRIVPLNLAADATVLYQPHADSFLLFLQVGVDLPGPIPIANTGLGIYGISGAFGANARPTPPPPASPDPIGDQLRWDSSDPINAFEFEADELTFGAQAVFGTVSDLGFSFSTRAGLFLSVPDIVVRGALWGKVLSPRMGVDEKPPFPPEPGASFMGVVVVDAANGVTVGLRGDLSIPVVLHVAIPLGAYFPTGAGETDNWYLYLGTDGYTGVTPSDGRGLGPMRAEILPDLITMHADAYLMLRGRGIEKWPRGGPVTVTDGMVLAFGFSYETTIGLEPIAWADVHASADILLATHPLTLAGFGAVGGSLNLGPFSIGVDAMLSLLAVENTDPYIQAKLCGHIDLLFTEIEGCVEISINSKPDLHVPLPDMHPLDNVQHGDIVGDLAFLIDDQYRRIGTLKRSWHDITDAERVWPDTLLHLSFAMTPNLAPGFVSMTGVPPAPAASQFVPISTYPCGVAAKPVGSDMLRYEWTLTGLALYDVTDDEDGVGALVQGPMSAAWQAGKDGDIGVRPQAGDLVLLTYQGDLFLNRLADGGAGLANDPIDNAATACQRREVLASLGWAIGLGATPAGSAFTMPADPISPDPCVSRFTAKLTQYVSLLPNIPLGVASAAQMPPPYDFTAASLETFTPQVKVERLFDGALDLGHVTGLSGNAALFTRAVPSMTATIEPQEAITSGRLWLIMEPQQVYRAPAIIVVDDRGNDNTWTMDAGATLVLPDNRKAVCFKPTVSGWSKTITMRWAVGHNIAVLGLGGITQSAQAAAAARSAAMTAASAHQGAATAKQPQQAGDTIGDGIRAILQPGRTYRLDVAMAWEGWLYQQDDKGNSTLADHVSNQPQYQPKGGSPVDNKRSFFFKTAPKPKPGPAAAVTKIAKYGLADHIATIRTRRDLFEPEMITRFLLGYTPEQTENARFCDDPVNAHFSAAHVLSLAKVYGYSLQLGVRRVDVPGADGNPILLAPKWIGLLKPQLLTGTDQRRYKVAAKAPCPMPKPGGTLQAVTPLATQAWYEVYVLAKSDDAAVHDGRLDGVTFQTSRWRNPQQMLAGIGFKSSTAPATGDIELTETPPLGVGAIDGSDADFEAALDALGLQGWPLAKEPRVSLLWLKDAAASTPTWKCAGVLVESPEPIDRPGRVELSVLRLVQQPQPAGVFDIRRSDRTRSRMLWLCSAPFTPRTWRRPFPFQPWRFTQPTVVLEMTDKVTGALLSGSLQLPLIPSFAEEA